MCVSSKSSQINQFKARFFERIERPCRGRLQYKKTATVTSVTNRSQDFFTGRVSTERLQDTLSESYSFVILDIRTSVVFASFILQLICIEYFSSVYHYEVTRGGEVEEEAASPSVSPPPPGVADVALRSLANPSR